MKIKCEFIFSWLVSSDEIEQAIVIIPMSHKHFKNSNSLVRFISHIQFPGKLVKISMCIIDLPVEDYVTLIPNWFRQCHGKIIFDDPYWDPKNSETSEDN